MEKAGLKTFVYSFVFSLFTVFCVNGLYLRVRPSGIDAKIPNKNITLFLKDLNAETLKSPALPTRKIALSILPDIPKKTIEVENKIPLNIDDLVEDDASYFVAENDTIPLEGELARRKSEETPLSPQSQDEPLPPEDSEEKIVDNFEELVTQAPPVDEKTMTASEPTPPEQEEIKLAALPEIPENKPQEMIVDTKILQHPKNFDDNDKPAAQILIPLEKDKGIIRTANKTIEVVNSPSVNLVALHSDNIPIKSMLSEENAKKTPASMPESKAAAWQSMSEKAPKASTNEPWLVAKSKNPQNSLIAESNSYKQDDAEIKRILSGRAENAEQDAQPVELASETVKNLLIPIPDDILKNENLTPQLASSQQNKAIEEKLHTDMGDENFKYNDTTQIGNTPTPQSGEKGGILNSLTSIFSSKNSNTPEIGTSIEGETQDSVFSSFSRRKTKSRNNKILPTEMRLSFQPNRAEISGQTLRWIRAFANKVNQDKSTGLEIRIDGTSAPALQQRRLNLLQNILVKENINYNKVNTVFTSREPNSFIIRTVKINTETEGMPKNFQQPQNNRYQQW